MRGVPGVYRVGYGRGGMYTLPGTPLGIGREAYIPPMYTSWVW